MANANLQQMLRKFGVVTVMDVDFYKAVRFTEKTEAGENRVGDWDAKNTFKGKSPLFSLRSLKISNINTEGPTKTAIGGQNADKLLKYGKTFTIEMQDALGSYSVLENIYGVKSNFSGTIVSVTDRFPAELTIVGTTFVIDQATGAKQPLKIIIPIFLGDGVFNLTQEAEGDVSVFDMNGDILRFEGGAISVSVVDGLYEAGADNEFYFFATNDAWADLSKGEVDYADLWGIEVLGVIEEEDIEEQSSNTLGIAAEASQKIGDLYLLATNTPGEENAKPGVYRMTSVGESPAYSELSRLPYNFPEVKVNGVIYVLTTEMTWTEQD